ncbi:MAG TPA: NUDIX domain-containing protein [Gemmatimonadales bacterium]|nr:NUDIX domain-containing protein [Gemmatimonadales bacterium]
MRGAGERLQVLTLRRTKGRNIGSWETIHGTIEAGERPEQASLRELREETGLVPEKFYNLSRTEAFYQHRTNEMVLIPVFAAFVPLDATVRLSEEHDRSEWLSAAAALERFAWPRERRAVEDILSIVGAGDAGLLEDVLRVS